MPSGSISLANAVPAPPGVFATSMPSDLSSEDRDSSSDSNNLRAVNTNCHSASNMVNGGGSLLAQPISTSTCAYAAMPPNSNATSLQSSSSKAPHFVMVRGEGGEDVDGEDDSYKNSNKIRKRNKSCRRIKDGGNRQNGTFPHSHNHGSSSVNKPLKVTIRRTAHSHILGGQEMCQPQQGDIHRHSPSNSNSVIYSSVSDMDLSPHVTISTRTDGNIPENQPRADSSASVTMPDKELEEVPQEDHQPVESVAESISATRKDASTCTTSCGTITEPDLLGPCEPGSKVVLEGIVWLETPGMMVINASWRGRAYLGTLLDASKNTLGPSCPDKMISSLSMVRGRHNWGNSGMYKNSVNNSSKLFNSINSSNSNTLSQLTGANGGIAMTTRAAAAAAAATDRTGTDEESGSARLSTTGRRRGIGVRGATGTKRKRRRGSANSSTTADLTPSTPLPAPGSESDTQQHHHQEFEAIHLSQFICPHPGCEKRFSDMLGVRFHLDMGHTRANLVEPAQSQTIVSNTQITTSKKPRDIEKMSKSNPPRLAKAKTDSSVSLTYADDDQPPPQLDRGPDDEVSIGGNDHTEPPAASPAYSDISDDGASPIPSSMISRSQLFQNGHRNNPSELFAAAIAASLPQNATPKSPLLNNSSPVGVRTTSPGGFYMRAPADFIGMARSGSAAVGGGGGPINGSAPPQKSPYDFPSTPYHPLPPNGLPPFGLPRSVGAGVIPSYPPHMSRSIGGLTTSINLPPQPHVGINDNKRFQTHFASVMAAAALPKSLSPQHISRQSPQSTSTASGMPFRHQ